MLSTATLEFHAPPVPTPRPVLVAVSREKPVTHAAFVDEALALFEGAEIVEQFS
ncbi:MAG: hypothetical protein ACYCW6_11980 [Candidatus Xenobia bacterium]